MAFSGISDEVRLEQLKRSVARLHGEVVEDTLRLARLCTVMVVAQPVKRTAKLCIGISLPNASLVTEEWISACESAGAFVDVAPFVLSGTHSSQPGANPWDFDAGESRRRTLSGPGCLEGTRFFVTGKTKPKPAELTLIIEAAGGSVLERPPNAASANAVVVSTDDERAVWAPLLARHKRLVAIRPEHLLSCVLRQELRLEKEDTLR